ncbi:MAG: InlB B-repeat-containing protein [Bacteroidaceae bacterium]|nr:InlB B-repeat-containing protein [Bacteroidaceae bacterium]
MKRIISFCMCLTLCMALFAQATDLTIDNQTPGWLSSKINYGDQQTVKNLKVTGYINETDLKFIGTLLQKNLKGCLNLYDANIVTEGDWKENTLSSSMPMFGIYGDSNEKLQSLYLPYSVTSVNINIPFPLDTLVFDTNDTVLEWRSISWPNSSNTHLIIGENVEVIDGGFFGLASVKLPSSVKKIGNGAFANAGTSLLGEQNLHANIEDLVNLETIGFKSFSSISPKSLPDTLNFPSMKEYSVGAFDYKDGMHVFLGENLEQIYYPSKSAVSSTEIWCSSNATVYFHIAAKNMIGIVSSMPNRMKFYVPKELVEEYKKQCPNLTFIAESVPLEEILLDKHEVVLDINEEIHLTATPVPANADNTDLIWNVDNPDIVTVSQSGDLRTLASGTAIVTASSLDGKIKDQCKVIVKMHALSVMIEPSELTFTRIGEMKQLQAVILPEETYDKSVKWSSSNTSVCTVTSSGMVVAMGYGEAVVMAITNDGELPATCVVKVSPEKYKLTYMVDGVEYKSYEVEYTSNITPEAAPVKEGYTFSGWSGIPSTMPEHDVTVTGTFTVNKYKVTYVIDGVTYKTFEVEYGKDVIREAEPTKEGYTFSGWSLIPTTMPAYDITITGTFTKGQYKLFYILDGQIYKTVSMDYGVGITKENAPEKEGYTFSGWSEIPETMPAHDVTVTGSFTINTYKVIYIVDGMTYKTFEVEYGKEIEKEAEPSKEGYTFSGWSEIPKTMPAHDVTITGNFTFVDGIAGVSMDGKTDGIYTLDGRKIEKLQKGVNIVKMPDGHVKKVFVK